MCGLQENEGGEGMTEILKCPLCSAKIRRQNRTVTQFTARFVRHIIHYHGDFPLEGDVE